LFSQDNRARCREFWFLCRSATDAGRWPCRDTVSPPSSSVGRLAISIGPGCPSSANDAPLAGAAYGKCSPLRPPQTLIEIPLWPVSANGHRSAFSEASGLFVSVIVRFVRQNSSTVPSCSSLLKAVSATRILAVLWGIEAEGWSPNECENERLA
jgi:hypothetical protein